LVIGVCILLNNAFSRQVNTTPEALLKRAYDEKDPAAGIALAEQALLQARRSNNKVVEIKSLSIQSEYYCDLRKYASAKAYAEYALTAAGKYHVDSLKGDAWLSLGMIDYGMGGFEQSIVEYERGAVEYKKANQLPGLATAYLNIGISKSKLSQYSDAIKHYLVAAGIFESLKNREYLSSTLSMIADSYSELGNYSKTLEYNRKALAIRQKLDNREAVAQSLNNIGFTFKQLKRPDSAIYYLTQSLTIKESSKDSSELVLTLQNLGSSWKMKGNLKRAEKYISRSLNIASKYNMTEEIARGNADMAEIYIQQKKIPAGFKRNRYNYKHCATLKAAGAFDAGI